MIINILRQTGRFLFFVLLQVLVLNNIQFNGYINPFLYVFIILMLPFETPAWLVMIVSFLAGILNDMFQDTMGMHAAASVTMGYLRLHILKLFSPRDGYDNTQEPTLYYLGFQWYLWYSLFLVVIHHFFFFFIEVFSFKEIGHTLIRAVFSTVATMLLLFLCQMLIYKPKDVRKK